MAPPARQARFAALKARHDSKFAWHGSPAENWHCILRSGLRSASGTKLQLHGAAHGAAGILLTLLQFETELPHGALPAVHASVRALARCQLPSGNWP